MSMIGTTTYTQLPLCVDGKGHSFTIPPTSSWAVCARCGLIRVQPAGSSNRVFDPPMQLIGPRCIYCGYGVANPGDACGICPESREKSDV